MKTSCRVDGDWTYFAIEDLDEAYQGRHGIADQLGLYLYFQPNSLCSYGALVPTASPHVDRAYQNFRRSLDDLFAQRMHRQSVPWASALLEWLRRVHGQHVDWWLTGSAALAIRGATISPGDIDIIVADEDTHLAEELLLDGLIQPMRPMVNWAHNTWGRAFLGARIDISGGIPARADQPFPTDHGPTAARCLETIMWQGFAIRVPPIDLHLRVSQVRGLSERVAEIERLMTLGPKA